MANESTPPRLHLPHAVFTLAKNFTDQESGRDALRYLYVNPQAREVQAMDGFAWARIVLDDDSADPFDGPFMVSAKRMLLAKRIAPRSSYMEITTQDDNLVLLITDKGYRSWIELGDAERMTSLANFWPATQESIDEIESRGVSMGSFNIGPDYVRAIDAMARSVNSTYLTMNPRTNEGPIRVTAKRDGVIGFEALVMPVRASRSES